jgi:peptidoglycan/xylan/chitin deacetylase (PgdA/CDA1 family)
MTRLGLSSSAIAAALCVAFSALAQVAPPVPRHPSSTIPPARERPQFVLFSFDLTPGARPLEVGNYLRFLRGVNARRPPSRLPNGYTLFLMTGGLQLHPWRRDLAPEEVPFRGVLPRARPVVRYAPDVNAIRYKVANIRALAEGGVEFGSHAVRHEHGQGWTLAQWRQEIADDARIMDLVGLPRSRGFRAPFLEVNRHTYTALAEHGYRYDVSGPGGPSWPTRHPRTGTWRFPIPSVNLPDGLGRVLYFDDNVEQVLRTRARARGLSGARADRWMDDVFVRAALEELERRLWGNRAPFVVGGHGNMAEATLQLMRRVCWQPEIRCATFSEAVTYLEAHPGLEGTPPVHGQLVLPVGRRPWPR